MIQTVFDVLSVSMLSALFIGGMLIMNRIAGKKYSLRWIQFIWLLLAVRLIIPSDLIHIPVSEQVGSWNSVSYSADVSYGNLNRKQLANVEKKAESKDNEVIAAGNEEHTATISPGKAGSMILIIHYGFIIFSAVWVMGVVLQLLRYSLSYIVFMKRLEKQNRPVQNSAYERILEQVNRKRLSISLYRNAEVKSPFSTGLFRKKIILPDKSYEEVEMEAILCHEYTHLCNHDIWFKMLLCAVKSVHWFNPMVYWMERAVSQNMELICDEAVVENRRLEYRQMYGMTILETIRDMTEQPQSCIVSYFEGEKNQMKERIRNIIKPLGRRKKPILITVLCVLLLAGSVITFEVAGKDKQAVNASSAGLKKQAEKLVKEEKEVTFLLAGVESIGGSESSGRTDSIVLLNWNPETRELAVRSLCRDMYVEVPGNGSRKLNAAYHIGGMDLLKKTISSNFGVTVDYGIAVGFEGCEKIIDLLGGIKLDITESEAEYLNTTNYISKKENRTLVAGENMMNGNQVLGYARVRYRKTATGKQNDFGRTERLQNILHAVLSKTKSLKLTDYAALLKEGYSNVDSELSVLQALPYMESLLKTEYTISSKTLPVEGSYEGAKKDGLSVIIWDKEKNLEAIKY